MATAVNFHSMASNLPLDFMPMHHNHSRSNSVSSSPNSRPQSSQGGVLRTASNIGPLSAEDLFRTSYQPRANPDSHIRNLAHPPSTFPLSSSDLISSADSPPNHNLTNPALKNHIRASHIRARAAASPYPRDADSVHSSSSETEDPSMFLAVGSPADYPSMFPGGHVVSSQETIHATGAFGRLTLSPDHTLEKLAANVRAATTTSASDRAKQIFVQAW
jgi:regulatory factor X, other